jgi:hypothetical protein
MTETLESVGKVNRAVESAASLLTICIPTHNRREVLEECLASVLPQAESLGVGVCVSDNCSSDDTWQLLETLKKQHPWMQVVRHTRDIGYRNNLIGAVLASRAQYVWPLGDKLVLLPGALEFMVATLVDLHPDAVVVNGCAFTAFSTGDRAYSAPQSCLTELGWWTTLCGATVSPGKAWVDALHLQPPNRDFPQVVALFSYLASLSAPRVLFLSRVFIQYGESARENQVAGYCAERLLETWGRGWHDTVMSLPDVYSSDEKLRAVRSKSEHGGPFDFRGLVRLRAQGQLTAQTLRADQIPLQAAVSTPWWFARVISVTPRWILRPVLHVHPRLMLRAVRRKLRLWHEQQPHGSTK